MAGRVKSVLIRTGAAITIVLALSVIVFDLVFLWFPPPADKWAAVVWFAYVSLGNLGLMLAGFYAAGYLGPIHLRRGRRKERTS